MINKRPIAQLLAFCYDVTYFRRFSCIYFFKIVILYINFKTPKR